jgi:hypothetical protein
MSLRGFKVGDSIKVKQFSDEDFRKAPSLNTFLQGLDKNKVYTIALIHTYSEPTVRKDCFDLPYSESPHAISIVGKSNHHWEWLFEFDKANQKDLRNYLTNNGDQKRATEFIRQLTAKQ